MTQVTSAHVARVEARLTRLTDECLSFASAYDGLSPADALDASNEKSTPVVLSLDHISTVAEAKAFSPDIPLRLMVWNVANLGGKFGYPVRRSNEVIEATARIIHAAKPDAAIILEILQHSRKTPEPRKPLIIDSDRSREAKDPVLSRLKNKGLLPSTTVDSKEASLPNVFFRLVNALIWPIVGNDSQAREELEEKKREARDGLPLRAREAFQTTCEPTLSQLVAAASLEPSTDEEEEEADDDDEAPSEISEHQRKRWDELGARPSRGRIEDENAFPEDWEEKPLAQDLPQLKWIRQGMLLLALEGQQNFLEDAWEERKPQKEKSGDTRLRTARNKRRKEVINTLYELLKKFWSSFLDEYCVALHRDGTLEGTPASVSRSLEEGRWSYFIGMTGGPRQAAYEKAMARWREENESTDSKSAKHPGLAEFVRIAKDLQALEPDFDYWPKDENEAKYHQGETYGVLWRQSRLVPQGAPEFLCHALKTRMPGLSFQKRQPVRARFKVKDNAGGQGPDVDLVGWHAPAPSTANAAARSLDFPAFTSFTEEARKDRTLGVLLSDLNINTQGSSTTIEHCATRIDRIGFFEDVIGRKGLPRLGKRAQFDRQSKAYSTMAKTKFVDGADSEEDFIVKVSRIVGASSYDKILPFSRREQDWKLYLRRFCAIPIPITLRTSGTSEDPFGSVDLSRDEVLRDFDKLFDAHPGIRDKLLDGAKPARDGAGRKRFFVHGARKLSDHFPVLADFAVRDTRVKHAADPAGATRGAVVRSIEDERRVLTEWCIHVRNCAGTPHLERAFEALMGFWHRATSLHTDPESLRLLEAALTTDTLDAPERDVPENFERWEEALSHQPDASGGSPAVPQETLIVLDNEGGGDCLFRALGQLLFRDEARHLDIRWALVAWLRAELKANAQGASGWRGAGSRLEFLEYLRAIHADLAASWPGLPLYRVPMTVDALECWAAQMEAPGTWGDTLALALASAYFNVHFDVWLTEESRTTFQALSFANDPSHERPTLVLWCREFVHFQACVTEAHGEQMLLEPPVDFSALAKRREVVQLMPPAPPPHVTDTSSKPVEPEARVVPSTARVFAWPMSKPWSPASADENPTALFLFTELDTSKGKRIRVNHGQAVLRLSENAVGIRTFESEAVGNDDAQRLRNEGWFKADLAEARRRLESGRYTTLVIPWDDTNDRCALGVEGGRDLEVLASGSYQALVGMLREFSRWADERLQRVMVVPRRTAVTEQVALRNTDSLFVVPTLLPLWEASQRRGSRVELQGGNVRALPVHPSPLASIAPHADEEQRLIQAMREVLSRLKESVGRGNYRTVEILSEKDKTYVELAAEALAGMSYAQARECLLTGWAELVALAAQTPYQPTASERRGTKREATEPPEQISQREPLSAEWMQDVSRDSTDADVVPARTRIGSTRSRLKAKQERKGKFKDLLMQLQADAAMDFETTQASTSQKGLSQHTPADLVEIEPTGNKKRKQE